IIAVILVRGRGFIDWLGVLACLSPPALAAGSVRLPFNLQDLLQRLDVLAHLELFPGKPGVTSIPLDGVPSVAQAFRPNHSSASESGDSRSVGGKHGFGPDHG